MVACEQISRSDYSGQMRVFVGIDLPQNVRDHLASALSMSFGPRAGRNPWIPSMNWHVTLGFFGEQPEGIVDDLTQNLAETARQTPPFDLNLSGAGTFRHDVCWIGVNDPANALGPLADKVRQTYATAHQHAQNRFHVTVSRSGRQSNLAHTMRALSVYQGPTWTVRDLVLYQSLLGEGPGGHPLYTPVSTMNLGGGGGGI